MRLVGQLERLANACAGTTALAIRQPSRQKLRAGGCGCWAWVCVRSARREGIAGDVRDAAAGVRERDRETANQAWSEEEEAQHGIRRREAR